MNTKRWDEEWRHDMINKTTKLLSVVFLFVLICGCSAGFRDAVRAWPVCDRCGCKSN
jgi:hypothetical protein